MNEEDAIKQATGFARIEALIEAGRKQAAESAETRERAAVERHNALAGEVRTLKQGHSNLVLVVEQLKTKAQQAIDDAHRSNHDLSEYKSENAQTNAALATHIKTIDTSLVSLRTSATDLATATTEQNVELGAQTESLGKQTTMLKHIRGWTPLLSALAAAIGSVVAAYFAHAPH